MIFNRTKQDVENAKEIRKNKVQMMHSLSADDIAILERGMLTINTLNRIEDKQSELARRLVDYGRSFFEIENKTWTENDIFNVDDLERIVNNLDKLTNAFAVMSDTPPTPAPTYSYQAFNDIEKILFDVDSLIENTASIVDFSWAIGTAHSGQYFMK